MSETATADAPPRDVAIDALRMLAMGGVVIGHWLVTALVVDGEGALSIASPLSHLPAFAPLTWLLQPLALFFFAGGYATARSVRRPSSRARWRRRRALRLCRPASLFLAGWTVLAGVLLLAGVPPRTVRTVATLVVSPLWFLVVYLILTSVAPLLLDRLPQHRRLLLVAPALVVAVVDVARFVLAGPRWLSGINVVGAWMVPFAMGLVRADGGLTGRRSAPVLVVGGAVATVLLVTWLGYPVSMVGVPGAAVSNLNPPTLAATSLAVTQAGCALVIHRWLTARVQTPRVRRRMEAANRYALPVFLWHQTALIVVTAVGLRWGVLPGLHTPPATLAWVVHRLLWLPAFAAMLAVLIAGVPLARAASRRAVMPDLGPGSCGGLRSPVHGGSRWARREGFEPPAS